MAVEGQESGGVTVNGTIVGSVVDLLKLNNPAYNPPTPLEFPFGLTNRNYYMNFYFSDYKAPGLNQKPITVINASIRLPIPSQLINDTAVHYQQDKLGAAVGAAAYATNNNATEMVAAAGVAASANNIIKKLPSSARQAISGVGTFFGGAANTYSKHQDLKNIVFRGN
jgi:hypothetical protein